MLNILKIALVINIASSVTFSASTWKDDPYAEEYKGNVSLLRIVEPPLNQTIMEDSVAHFICRVEGVQIPRIIWKKWHRTLRGRRFISMPIPGGSLLRIDPVHPIRDEAMYECAVEDEQGDTITAEAYLNILSSQELPIGFPKLEHSPRNTAVQEGRAAVFRCAAMGSPTPGISWLKDMVPLSEDTSKYSLQEGGGHLFISNTSSEDEGRYECIAENSVGTVISRSASLYVKQRRIPPMFSISPDRAYEVLPGSRVEIPCVAVGSPMPLVSWKMGDLDATESEIGKNLLILENVTKSANYTCLATSSLGATEAHTQVLVHNLPRAPTNLQMSNLLSESVSLTWEYEAEGDNIQYYTIFYRPIPGPQNYSEISGIISRHYRLMNLSPSTMYEISVAASNTMGRGAASHSVRIRTETDITQVDTAPAIKNLTVYDEDHNVVMITCEAFGNPRPRVMWKSDDNLNPNHYWLNVTETGGNVISTLILSRTAFVYTQYKCEANNAIGNDTRSIVVPYNGDHPPVQLERAIMSISEDVKIIKEDLEMIKDAVM